LIFACGFSAALAHKHNYADQVTSLQAPACAGGVPTAPRYTRITGIPVLALGVTQSDNFVYQQQNNDLEFLTAVAMVVIGYGDRDTNNSKDKQLASLML